MALAAAHRAAGDITYHSIRSSPTRRAIVSSNDGGIGSSGEGIPVNLDRFGGERETPAPNRPGVASPQREDGINGQLEQTGGIAGLDRLRAFVPGGPRVMDLGLGWRS